MSICCETSHWLKWRKLAAYDERFKVCIPNQTGAVGVQLMKRDYGETLNGVPWPFVL